MTVYVERTEDGLQEQTFISQTQNLAKQKLAYVFELALILTDDNNTTI